MKGPMDHLRERIADAREELILGDIRVHPWDRPLGGTMPMTTKAEARPHEFRGLVRHFDEAAKARKGSAARAKLLPPVRAFSNLITQAVGHARKGDPASLRAACRSLEHAESEIITLMVATEAAAATLEDARSLIHSLGGKTMAKKDEPPPDPTEGNEAKNFKRDPGAPEVSGEPYPDPSQSNIGAIRAGKESPADTEADNAETDEVAGEQEAEEKKSARKSARRKAD